MASVMPKEAYILRFFSRFTRGKPGKETNQNVLRLAHLKVCSSKGLLGMLPGITRKH